MHSVQHESILSAIYYRGWTGEEPETLPIWFNLAQKVKTIIDVGAHVGHFSIVAGLANSDAQIYSIEPLHRVAALLRQNILLSDVHNVFPHQLAAGRLRQTAPFYAVPEGIPSSSSLSKEFMASSWQGEMDEVEVEIVPLDELVLDFEGPVLIKIDTETTEADVIAGASRIISETQPLIFLEVLADHETGPAIERELALCGYHYTPYLLTGNGLAMRHAIRGEKPWRNYLLMPTQGPLANLDPGILK